MGASYFAPPSKLGVTVHEVRHQSLPSEFPTNTIGPDGTLFSYIKRSNHEQTFFLAEKRHFAPGFEKQDWLKAKQQIMAQIEGSNRPLK